MHKADVSVASIPVQEQKRRHYLCQESIKEKWTISKLVQNIITYITPKKQTEDEREMILAMNESEEKRRKK